MNYLDELARIELHKFLMFTNFREMFINILPRFFVKFLTSVFIGKVGDTCWIQITVNQQNHSMPLSATKQDHCRLLPKAFQTYTHQCNSTDLTEASEKCNTPQQHAASETWLLPAASKTRSFH